MAGEKDIDNGGMLARIARARECFFPGDYRCVLRFFDSDNGIEVTSKPKRRTVSREIPVIRKCETCKSVVIGSN